MSFLREAIARLEADATAPGRGGLGEVLPAAPGDAPAALGFALDLARRRAGPRGAIVWIADEMTLAQHGFPYAPGLVAHGVDPARVVLVRALDAREALWAMEEALRSPAPAVVLGEVWNAARHCDLAATRRLAIAARVGGALGILLHPAPAPGALSTAARDRFEVRAASGASTASAGGRRPVFGVPARRVERVKGQGSDPVLDHQGALSGAALSEPAHPRRAHSRA